MQHSLVHKALLDFFTYASGDMRSVSQLLVDVISCASSPAFCVLCDAAEIQFELLM